MSSGTWPKYARSSTCQPLSAGLVRIEAAAIDQLSLTFFLEVGLWRLLQEGFHLLSKMFWTSSSSLSGSFAMRFAAPISFAGRHCHRL